MGRKAKYTKQQKVKACLDYLNETKSSLQIARELAMGKGGKGKVLFWVKMYSQYGESTFEERRRNKSYSKDFKEKVVQEYLTGKGSTLDLSIKYNLQFFSSIKSGNFLLKSCLYVKPQLSSSFWEAIFFVIQSA